jgi:hypothetical protein
MLRKISKHGFPKLKRGGVISGDDFDIELWIGVVRAVADFFEGNKVLIERKPGETGNLWICFK